MTMQTPSTSQSSPQRARLLAEAIALDQEFAILATGLEAAKRNLGRLRVTRILDVRADWDLPYRAEERIFDHLQRRISEALGEGGVPLEMDCSSIVARFFDQDGYARTKVKPGFSAAAVAQALLDEFEPKRMDMASRQHAETVNELFLKYGEPRVIGGRTVLSQRAWLTDHPVVSNQYSYDSQRRIEQALRMLAVLLPRITGDTDPDEVEHLLSACVREFEANRWVCSRSYRGHLGPIEIRLFQKKVEYWLPEEVAAALNLFVSMHARMAA